MNWKHIVLALIIFAAGGLAMIGAIAFAVGTERWAARGPVSAPPNYFVPAQDYPELGEPGEALATRYVKAAEASAKAQAQIAVELLNMRSAFHIIACTDESHSDIAYMIRRHWLTCRSYGDSM